MKYKPMYLPYLEDRGDIDNQPLFDTEDEAWEYIHDKYCHCGLDIISSEDYCRSCEAEWTVQEIK